MTTNEEIAQSILQAMDVECDKADAWPIFFGDTPDRAYNAMRMLVLTDKGGDGWALYFEVLEGSSPKTFFNCRYVVTHGHSVCLNRNLYTLRKVDLEEIAADEKGVTIDGSKGELEVTWDELAALHPLQATASQAKNTRYSLLVRAYLQAFPDFWHGTVEQSLDDLKIGIEAWQSGIDVLLVSKSFEHVVGNASKALDPNGVDLKWRQRPSKSTAYQSLAKVFAAKDAKLFQPGSSNLDWRMHLDAIDPQRKYID